MKCRFGAVKSYSLSKLWAEFQRLLIQNYSDDVRLTCLRCASKAEGSTALYGGRFLIQQNYTTFIIVEQAWYSVVSSL